MDPIQALVEEYNEYVSSNKENTARASHLKNIIDALKSEGIIHKTNSNELVSVPSFIFTEIKKMFKEEGTVSIQDTPRSIPQKALEVFSVGEEREQEKLKKARGKRVIRFKKTLSKVLLNEMRLDLKRKSRINVIFIADENLNNKSSFLLQIPLESISQVISNLESYNESYKREESNDIKEIKPAIVSEGLTDAENNSRRKKMINMMIAALKEEDRIESIKASTSSGVRISLLEKENKRFVIYSTYDEKTDTNKLYASAIEVKDGEEKLVDTDDKDILNHVLKLISQKVKSVTGASKENIKKSLESSPKRDDIITKSSFENTKVTEKNMEDAINIMKEWTKDN